MYKELTELIFCRLLLLNRRRPGELERILLSTYEESQQTENNKYEEFTDALTHTEKCLIKKFRRIVIRGKRGRGVPVFIYLLTPTLLILSLDTKPLKNMLKCLA